MSALNSWWRRWFASDTQPTPERDREARGASEQHVNERRVHDRYACEVAGSCRPAAYGEENQWPARISNVSRGGIGLLAKRRFESGTLLRVEITAKTDELPETLWACVVHVQPYPDNEWLLGCALARQLSEAELQSLLHVPKGECTLVRQESEKITAS